MSRYVSPGTRSSLGILCWAQLKRSRALRGLTAPLPQIIVIWRHDARTAIQLILFILWSFKCCEQRLCWSIAVEFRCNPCWFWRIEWMIWKMAAKRWKTNTKQQCSCELIHCVRIGVFHQPDCSWVHLATEKQLGASDWPWYLKVQYPEARLVVLMKICKNFLSSSKWSR